MKVELIAYTPEPELLIEKSARICYDSFDKINPPESTIKIIDHIIKSGHESVLEHANATFFVSEVSRALTHQLVRHRIASYSQRSQRYVKETEQRYVTPPSIKNFEEVRLPNNNNIVNVETGDLIKTNAAKSIFIEAMYNAWNAYNELLKLGIKSEDARFVLPNACETEIIMTMNFRELRHFFKLRANSSQSQWEIRKMAKIMLQLISEIAPNVFNDIKFK
jgi:thymidylate synthase (FAD)